MKVGSFYIQLEGESVKDALMNNEFLTKPAAMNFVTNEHPHTNYRILRLSFLELSPGGGFPETMVDVVFDFESDSRILPSYQTEPYRSRHLERIQNARDALSLMAAELRETQRDEEAFDILAVVHTANEHLVKLTHKFE